MTIDWNDVFLIFSRERTHGHEKHLRGSPDPQHITKVIHLICNVQECTQPPILADPFVYLWRTINIWDLILYTFHHGGLHICKSDWFATNFETIRFLFRYVLFVIIKSQHYEIIIARVVSHQPMTLAIFEAPIYLRLWFISCIFYPFLKVTISRLIENSNFQLRPSGPSQCINGRNLFPIIGSQGLIYLKSYIEKIFLP